MLSSVMSGAGKHLRALDALVQGVGTGPMRYSAKKVSHHSSSMPSHMIVCHGCDCVRGFPTGLSRWGITSMSHLTHANPTMDPGPHWSSPSGSAIPLLSRALLSCVPPSSPLFSFVLLTQPAEQHPGKRLLGVIMTGDGKVLTGAGRLPGKVGLSESGPASPHQLACFPQCSLDPA